MRLCHFVVIIIFLGLHFVVVSTKYVVAEIAVYYVTLTWTYFHIALLQSYHIVDITNSCMITNLTRTKFTLWVWWKIIIKRWTASTTTTTLQGQKILCTFNIKNIKIEYHIHIHIPKPFHVYQSGIDCDLMISTLIRFADKIML